MRGGWKICFIGVVLLVAVAGCIGGPPPVVHVSETGSDEKAATFQKQWLARMVVDAFASFNTDSVNRDFSRLALDSSKLVLLEPTAVRVYFVASQGGFMSALGYWLEGEDLEDPGPNIIFPNASSPKKLAEYAQLLQEGKDILDPFYMGTRRGDAPVLPGDFIDLGILPAGTKIGFFLISDAVNGAKGKFTTDIERNPDKVQHVVTMAYQDSPYLMLAFEDLMGGGDKTYNDVVFTVEMSESSIQALSDVKRQREMAELLRVRELRRQARNRILLGTAAAIAISGPFALWSLRLFLRRRRIRLAYKQAQGFLDAGNVRESLRMLREAERRGAPKSMRRRWASIEVEACKKGGDPAQLLDVYTRNAEAVLKDESASLMCARAGLEIERTDAFHALRGAWQEKEQRPWSWTMLESDYLTAQEKTEAAEGLLRQRTFDGAHDAVRLARLAELRLREAPAEAEALLTQALTLAPGYPEVLRSKGAILERVGNQQDAEAAWRDAAQAGGTDPFHRDHYCEYLVRRRDFRGALTQWAEALAPPSVDMLWVKAAFWERLAAPGSVAWDGIERPLGARMPLVECLLKLPEGCFWHAVTMEPVTLRMPELVSCPECTWLRVVQALLENREEQALALLAASRADRRRYFDALDAALRQILTFRRMQFLNPGVVILGQDTPEAWRIPLFKRIDAWAGGRLEESPEALGHLLSSPGLFGELFRALGWEGAAVVFEQARAVVEGGAPKM